MKIILIRGAPAVGKTTITKKLLSNLKLTHSKNCAYICEDDFRKQMQYKYKSSDLQVHINSATLIQTTINKLLELDSYDYIFIEGQFRYKEVLDNYFSYLEENSFEYSLFQFNLDLVEMMRRDTELRNTKSPDIESVKSDIDSYVPDKTIIVETSRDIDEVSSFVLKSVISN